MFPRLLHIYGPLWVHSYGTIIAIGFLVFLFITYRHPKRTLLISGEQYLDTLFLGLLAGIVGGRILFVISDWYYFWEHPLDSILPWVGGFTVLGSIIGILITIPPYLHYHKIPILPLLDLVSQFAPLLQAISRIGCLMAGCCYGILAPTIPWAITFTNPESTIPPYLLGLPLHPTQIYLSLASFGIFLFLYFFSHLFVSKAGQLTCIYLILESLSRFTIDFWRGDRGDLIELTSFNRI